METKPTYQAGSNTRTLESIRKFYAPYFQRAKLEGYELTGGIADVAFLLGEYARLTELTRRHSPDEIPPDEKGFEKHRYSIDVLLVAENGDKLIGYYHHLKKTFYEDFAIDGPVEIIGWYFLPESEPKLT
jgi:hypothetical protein